MKGHATIPFSGRRSWMTEDGAVMRNAERGIGALLSTSFWHFHLEHPNSTVVCLHPCHVGRQRHLTKL